MKIRVKKLLNFLITAFLLLSAGLLLYMFTGYKGDYPEYSTYSTEKEGIKALYLLTGKMGYRTERYYYPAVFLKDEAAMVAYCPALTVFNEESEKESLKAWILKGNTLILIPDRDTLNLLWIFDTISELKQRHEIINIGNVTVTFYGFEKGEVYIIDESTGFLNSDIKDSDAPVAFIRVLERISPKKVIFNEYYHHMQKAAPGIWQLVGLPGQLVLIQLLVVIILIAVRGWKPFGRIRNERKIGKRPENEVIKALSGLYIRMKAYPLVLSNYYGYYTRKYGDFFNTPGNLQDVGRNLLRNCEYFIESGTRNRKELLLLVQKLEKLEEKINLKK